ncbi:MAG TPA: helix-turn-helix transcriptional regulator [Candidatus Nitrosotenuis sp.]|jgi:DNA-binding CsgD family transcriptional regulator|nr:helix-turn-helix transcriptional regulator [Candidatus Nitrosotenuis sp.]
MEKKNFSQNHHALEYALSYSQKLQALTSSLFQAFGLTTFGYKRLFSDGYYLFFSTNLSWVEYHIKNLANHGNFFVSAMNEALMNDGFYRVLWPIQTTDYFLDALHHWGMWNGLNFYKRNSNFIELWTFSTTPEQYQDPNAYLNIIPYLEKFIIYFNVISAETSTSISSQNLAIYNDYPRIFTPPSPSILNQTLQSFLEQISLNQLPIFSSKGRCVLSRQETLCLKLIVQGKSLKEIAHFLNLSPRTIEDYVSNIRSKTGISSRSGLVTAFYKTLRQIGYRDLMIDNLLTII